MNLIYTHFGDEGIITCIRCKQTYSFTREEVKIFESEPGGLYGYVEYYVDCPNCRRPLEVDIAYVNK